MQNSKNKFFRLIWISLVLGLFSICIVYAIPIVQKWTKNPIELAFEQKFVSIKKIPFPAITICPLHMPNKNLFDYENFLGDVSLYGFNKSDVDK